MPPEKRTRRALTAIEKRRICERKREKPTPKNKDLAIEFACGETTISDILKNAAKWLEVQPDSTKASVKKERPPKWPELERALSIWVEYALAAELDLTGAILLNKAQRFADSLNIPNFKGSEGWLTGFKERLGLRQFTKEGEAGSAPSPEILEQYRRELQDILRPYAPQDIWNADETGLFWKMLPSKTLARGRVAGRKKDKARVTLLACCNSLGTEKLPLVFIHRFQRPRPMRNINYSLLPVSYYWNDSAWMQVCLVFYESMWICLLEFLKLI
jgi:hypothetical protein